MEGIIRTQRRPSRTRGGEQDASGQRKGEPQGRAWGGEALAINHCQAGFVKEAGPAVLEEPDRENGEGEQ